MEVEPFGIDVVVIEPGGIRTEWPTIAADRVRPVSGAGPYAPQAKATAPDYYALWQALGEESRDPNLPIRIGETISVEVFSPPIFTALCPLLDRGDTGDRANEPLSVRSPKRR